MMIELGGGTNPHPRADIVIDRQHPKGSPPQHADWGWDESLGWEVDRLHATRTKEVALLPRAFEGPTRTYHSLADGTADEVYASHFIEHIPKGPPLIKVMNEAWRVLKPGGTFTLIMPLVGYTDITGQPHVVQTQQFWADPTHVGAWWLPQGLRYFTGEAGVEADYGIKQWAPLGRWISWEDCNKILATDLELQAGPWRSWWSVRDRWEGVARLVKP